jgi:hypothetical protein
LEPQVSSDDAPTAATATVKTAAQEQTPADELLGPNQPHSIVLASLLALVSAATALVLGVWYQKRRRFRWKEGSPATDSPLV